ncbi:hypothetical protein TRSC58_07273 [Trypanosoma rangeli SC58]|uniref:Uncharacterized protein n=1 Tax=Trypanosoma rangeli SC58 TaxID=429131 RepID=A0A061IVU1_TRYRA|nr:hypothetical protein TRSC58_07273 [Trypanosoma rangeli SC58]
MFFYCSFFRLRGPRAPLIKKKRKTLGYLFILLLLWGDAAAAQSSPDAPTQLYRKAGQLLLCCERRDKSSHD